MNIASLLLVGSILVLLGVLASKVSARLGVPSLLLFLGLGMLAGSEGLGGIPFDRPELAMLIGTIALSLILFDGGLQVDLGSMDRRMYRDGIALATVGVGLTALLLGAFAALALGIPWGQALLLGGVLSSTDAAAVFAILRARGIGVPSRLRSLLEFESGSNDPTAVFLTTTMISVLDASLSSPAVLPLLFIARIGGGGVLGWAFGRATVWLLDRIDLEHEGLYPVLTLSLVGVTFGVAELLGGNGFMAVYTAGLTLAGRVFLHRKSLMRFHEGLAWLMQIAMFLILGLLVFPSQLPAAAPVATLVSVALILVARPLAVFITLAFSEHTLREKAFLAWVGLRGAAPVVLATFVLVADVPGSQTLFNVVFFAVILSVLLQGTTVGWAARWLGIAEPVAEESRFTPIEVNMAGDAGVRVKRLLVAEGSEADGERLMTVGGPDRPLVVMLRRGRDIIVPTGGTRLQAGDELFALGDRESIAAMWEIVSVPRSVMHEES